MEQAKERPILFSAEMVRKILAGKKTVARRVIKPQPSKHHWEYDKTYRLTQSKITQESNGRAFVRFYHRIRSNPQSDIAADCVCPYGYPGDCLWVRETHSIRLEPCEHAPNGAVWYRASDTGKQWDGELRWRPSIHMPRWASRILLKVTDIRVERLQDISEKEAAEEGASAKSYSWPEGSAVDQAADLGGPFLNGFRELWESINGKRQGCSWVDNPWVWVVEFKRLGTKQDTN